MKSSDFCFDGQNVCFHWLKDKRKRESFGKDVVPSLPGTKRKDFLFLPGKWDIR